MPRLYEYFGIIVHFFSREHEPIHVHGKYQDREMKAEIHIDIVRAEYAGGYQIRLWFSDGKNHIVDFEPFLIDARNPMSTQYRDMKKFLLFRIEYGTLVWGDDEMSFSTEDLYNNDIGVEMNIDDRQKLEAMVKQFANP
jgi:hypothetical protein